MNCLDLFAGAGGLTEGFVRAGFNMVAHIEKEKPASLTLKTRIAYHYLKKINQLEIYYKYLQQKISREELYSFIPKDLLNSVINEEINDQTIENIFLEIDKIIKNKKIDIIIGGPPCQAYSLVGRAVVGNKIKKDHRNYLYKQYLKFLKKYSPNYFVFENVRGMLSAKDEDGNIIFKNILAEMNELEYNVEYKLLDAKDFGVPQSRKRVIILGWKKNIKFSFPNFSKIENNITLNELFRDLPKLNAGEKLDFIFIKNKINNSSLKKLHILDENSDIVTQNICRPNKKEDLEIYKIVLNEKKKGKSFKYVDLPKELIFHKNLSSFLDRFKALDGDGISHTMLAHISKDGHYYIHPDIFQNRSITVREAARIQTFPDDYFFEDSRTAAFTQIGNAVPPLMAEIIAQKIKNLLDNYLIINED
ncbi:DNA cytosine methyltransferase [Fusobacterium polymorphum]|uniref:DNA cytosine methyltransferase n=1 Tax=Fusobacterium nucleatum subsp. polymorphum TaxID=76857 RepID=UPI001C6DEA5F|nr:DNA (cytosine-5-)-methyltransferase [Fusobacterium polymorphum]QYR61830.1 DNA (cytosine-5-)-methyltransferase [Fusobacterium polymorphum]